MKKEHLHDAIGNVNDPLIEETARLREKGPAQRRKQVWETAVAAVLTAVIAFGGIMAAHFAGNFLHGGNENPTPGHRKIHGTADPGSSHAHLNETPASDPSRTESHETETPGTPSSVMRLAAPVYPPMAPFVKDDSEEYQTNDLKKWAEYEQKYAQWQKDAERQRKQMPGYPSGLLDFAVNLADPVLNVNSTENRLFSPLNIYMALSMLAEMTDDKTRNEILDVLNVPSIDNLRTKTDALWNAHYIDDGLTKSILGASIWIDRDLHIKKEQ